MASGLKQRINTAIIIGIPILFLVFFNDLTRLAFLGLLSLLASYEFLSISNKSGGNKKLNYFSFICGVALIFIMYTYNNFHSWFLLASVIVNIFLICDLFYIEKSQLKEYPHVYSILYIMLPLGLLIQHFIINESAYFGPMLISILLLIWVSDISAYFVGKSTGKRKLFPSVSPGKTWEGFLGAGMLTVIFSYAFFSYFKIMDIRTWAIIGLAIWLFGSIGDLVESKFKRKAGIKDSGTILPGHGGFLDRFDGFIFCIPFVLSVIYFFQNF